MIKSFLYFITLLLFVMLITFFIHSYSQHFLGIGFFEKNLLLNYSFNFLLTSLFYFVLLKFKEKNSPHLGYVFLFSSMLKFLLFFIFIKPLFNGVSGLRSAEFIAFFIPYTTSLFLEIYLLVRLINKDGSEIYKKYEK